MAARTHVYDFTHIGTPRARRTRHRHPECTIFPLPGAEIRVTMPLFGAKQEFVKKIEAVVEKGKGRFLYGRRLKWKRQQLRNS